MLKRSLLAGLSISLVFASNDSRLSEAAMEGDREAVRTLIQQKADIDGAQGDGTTALHWAAFKDDMELVKMLVAAGANVRATTREGAITPLFMACTNGDAAMIEALIKAGANAKSVKSNGTTALMTAAASGSVDSVKVLLDHGADVNAKETAHGQTALMFAAALNRADVVKLLLARKADANITTSVRKLERVRFDQDGNVVEDRGGRGGAQARRGSRPDVAASKEAADKADEAADAQTAAEALKKASDAERADLEALARGMALKSVQFKIAKVVAKVGDVAFRPPRKVGADFQGGMTALLYAAREGHMETVRALVEGGADVNVVSAGDKFSPMVEAITNGHLDLAKYLLEHGTDPNLANISGLTALYATIDVQWAPHAWFPQPNTEQEKTGYLELMKQLIAKGANVNAPISEKLWFRSFTNDYTWVDPAGATPFWRAAQSSDIAAMKLLVEHGADPKLATKAGDTPLHAATGIGWAANWSVNAPVPLIDAVKYCVELGNDVNAADNRGYTALHGAAYLGDNEMVTYLVSKGAKIDVKSKTGDSAADMANGPTRFGQPHAETVALLEKLGSPNSHNCRSDQCVVAAHANVYDRPLSPAEQADKDGLEKVAAAFGFKGIEYRAEAAGGRGATGSQN